MENHEDIRETINRALKEAEDNPREYAFNLGYQDSALRNIRHKLFNVPYYAQSNEKVFKSFPKEGS